MTRILLVDDDIDCIRPLAKRLRLDKFAAIAVNLPQAAIEMLDGEPFDVVVSDFEMPRIDGAAVLRHARAKQPHARLFLATGDARGDDLALEGVVLLLKPLSYRTLLAHLRTPSSTSPAPPSSAVHLELPPPSSNVMASWVEAPPSSLVREKPVGRRYVVVTDAMGAVSAQRFVPVDRLPAWLDMNTGHQDVRCDVYDDAPNLGGCMVETLWRRARCEGGWGRISTG